MRTSAFFLALVALLSAIDIQTDSLPPALLRADFRAADANAAGEPAVHLGPVEDTSVILAQDPSCDGTAYQNNSQLLQDAYAWQYGGIDLPSSGAFAEKFSGTDSLAVCEITLDLCSINGTSGRVDLFVWDDSEGIPGRVLCVRRDVQTTRTAPFPEFEREVLDLNACCVGGDFWVGFAGLWTGEQAPIFIGADLQGTGGRPFTNIQPGIGYPSGWRDVSLVWPGTRALAIGCRTLPCSAVPVEPQSWGRVKTLYRND